MKSKINLLYLFLYLSINSTAMNAQDSSSVTWLLNKADSAGGYPANPLNEYPAVVSTDKGDVLLFDGKDDAILVENCPLEGAESFTIEVVLRPDPSSNPDNFEQRYIHIRGKANDTRRILLELRLTPEQKWYLDTFIQSEINNKTLVNTELLHESGKWYHIALVYDNGIMRHYVNGVEEASGKVTYLPVENGQISIGARQNPRSWFKGAIHLIKFTKRALRAEGFLVFSPLTP